MIVHTMTMQEINKEIEKDYPEIYNYCNRSLQHYEKKYKKNKVSKSKLTRYNSKNGNEWICVFYPYENSFTFSIGVFIPQAKSYMIGFLFQNIKYDGKLLVYFTKHFFDRYKERMKLSNDRYEIFKTFFVNDTLLLSTRKFPIDIDNFKVAYKSKNGLLLGDIYNKIPASIIRTFISKEMVKSGQIDNELIQQELIDTTYNIIKDEYDIVDKTLVEDNFVKILKELSW